MGGLSFFSPGQKDRNMISPKYRVARDLSKPGPTRQMSHTRERREKEEEVEEEEEITFITDTIGDESLRSGPFEQNIDYIALPSAKSSDNDSSSSSSEAFDSDSEKDYS